MSDRFDLTDTPAHLGLGATVVPLTGFSWGPEFFEPYEQRTASDGAEGRLVSYHRSTEPWNEWEMHPVGEELVLCTEGSMTVHQEVDGEVSTVELSAGQGIVNAAGVWHSADVVESATSLFITAGRGTRQRPR